MLAARGLTVQYPDMPATALEAAALTLDAGELVVVAGPNGSGKSTLQRALLGLIPLHQGEVTLEGRPLASWSRADIAARIGALPQREEPGPSLRVHESIAMGRWSRLGPFDRLTADDQRAIGQAIERCDLAALADRPVDTLSGGEWQRTRVARALAVEPRLLILDEPTAALDLAHEMELFELLHRLTREGLGVMVITHQLNLAMRFADRLLLLDRGRIAGAGRPDDVATAERLTAVFGWPVQVRAGDDGVPQIIPQRVHPAASAVPPMASTSRGTPP